MTILEPIRKNAEKRVSISLYAKENKNIWDDFVSRSNNGVFLFYRDYMDYHSDRFKDHSLMFYHNGRLVALLPANELDGVLYSHGGLTFGGMITSGMNMPLMLEIFRTLKKDCADQGFSKIIYKSIPFIYHSTPTDYDLFALFQNEAKLIGRNLSSCIYLSEKRKFDAKRKEAVTKAKRSGLEVKQSYDFKGFMKMVDQVVTEKHDAKPVHSSEEMDLLAKRFPNNIKLFCSYKDDVVLAGCLIYESKNVAHGQYAANSAEGRKLGAQDIIIDYLINDYYSKKKYFDFGISTLNLGKDLNAGLISHKESFGASAIVYDFYELPLAK